MKGDDIQKNIFLKKPEVREKIVQLRDSEEYRGWEDLTDKFNKAFNTDFSISAVRETYNRAIATSVIISGPKDNPLKEFASSMSQRLEGIMAMSDTLKDILAEQITWLKNCKELEPMARLNTLGKVIAQHESINSAMIKQISLVASQLEQVKVEQNKIQWTEDKVHEEISNILPNILRSLEEPDENGNQRIVVLDRSLLQE
jgi:hypothetical protein